MLNYFFAIPRAIIEMIEGTPVSTATDFATMSQAPSLVDSLSPSCPFGSEDLEAELQKAAEASYLDQAYDMLTNPTTAAVAGFSGLGLVAYKLYNRHGKKIAQEADKGITQVATELDNLVEVLDNILNTITDEILSPIIVEAIRSLSGEAINAIKGLKENITELTPEEALQFKIEFVEFLKAEGSQAFRAVLNKIETRDVDAAERRIQNAMTAFVNKGQSPLVEARRVELSNGDTAPTQRTFTANK